MRATSSSSAISRLSRSESALTVWSISFFWSSLSLSQRLSSACTDPLTPGSGERSSWATVATKVGPLPVEAGPAPAGADRDRDLVDRTGRAPDARCGRRRAPRSPSGPATTAPAPRCAWPARVGPVVAHPGVVVLVPERQHLGHRPAHPASGAPSIRTAIARDHRHPPVRAGEHHAVGQGLMRASADRGTAHSGAAQAVEACAQCSCRSAPRSRSMSRSISGTSSCTTAKTS